MFTSFKKVYLLILIIPLFFNSCKENNDFNSLIVYPAYCKGCVYRNFEKIGQEDLRDEFVVYLDTSDQFLKEQVLVNNLNFVHIHNSDIAIKFGDFSNLVVKNKQGNFFELRTNETIEKGKHFD